MCGHRESAGNNPIFHHLFYSTKSKLQIVCLFVTSTSIPTAIFQENPTKVFCLQQGSSTSGPEPSAGPRHHAHWAVLALGPKPEAGALGVFSPRLAQSPHIWENCTSMAQ